MVFYKKWIVLGTMNVMPERCSSEPPLMVADVKIHHKKCAVFMPEGCVIVHNQILSLNGVDSSCYMAVRSTCNLMIVLVLLKNTMFFMPNWRMFKMQHYSRSLFLSMLQYVMLYGCIFNIQPYSRIII